MWQADINLQQTQCGRYRCMFAMRAAMRADMPLGLMCAAVQDNLRISEPSAQPARQLPPNGPNTDFCVNHFVPVRLCDVVAGVHAASYICRDESAVPALIQHHPCAASTLQAVHCTCAFLTIDEGVLCCPQSTLLQCRSRMLSHTRAFRGTAAASEQQSSLQRQCLQV